MQTPRLNPRFSIEHSGNSKVTFTDEARQHVFDNALLARIVQHVDGQLSITGLSERMEPDACVLQVTMMVHDLERLGLLYDASPVVRSSYLDFKDREFPSMCACAVPVAGIYGLGKGHTQDAARISATYEAVEVKNSSIGVIPIHIEGSSMASISGEGVHPNDVQLYSVSQATPIDPHTKLDWVELLSAVSGRSRFLPRSVIRPRGHDYNGMAAGPSHSHALRHGLLEVVERDAISVWWYNRTVRHRVAWQELGDAYLDELDEFFARRDRSWCILDVTSDLGIPVFVAIVHGPVVMGFGSHTDPIQALRKAATELAQMCVLREQAAHLWDNSDCLRWWSTIDPAAGTYLNPAEVRPLAGVSHVDPVERVADAGYDVLTFDWNDTNDHVLRVFAPGLRPAVPRFAPGRLFDVPVKMGLHDAPLTERDMNCPLFPN